MLALVVDGRIVSVTDTLPPLARDTTTGDWVVPAEGQWTPEDLARVGLQPVVDTPRPTSTDTTTYTRSFVLVDGVPTVTWAPRPWLPGERPTPPVDLVSARASIASATTIATLRAASLKLVDQLATAQLPSKEMP